MQQFKQQMDKFLIKIYGICIEHCDLGGNTNEFCNRICIALILKRFYSENMFVK